MVCVDPCAHVTPLAGDEKGFDGWVVEAAETDTTENVNWLLVTPFACTSIVWEPTEVLEGRKKVIFPPPPAL
jgi:hypothetical protein